MTIFEFLKNPIFNLPGASQARSYETIFIDAMNEYLDLFEELDDFEIHGKKIRKVVASELGDKASAIGNGIIETLKDYYNGKPYEAFYAFKEILDGTDFIFQTETVLAGKDLYRVRVAEQNSTFTREEFFHIPYEMKYKVAIQRYSIPGFPSLHLSDSVRTCWEELKRPALEKMHVSRFRLDQPTYHFLEIPHPKKRILKNVFGDKILENTIGLGIESLLVNFPLYLACSIGVKSPQNPFKVEYVIPQLLLQYVRQNSSIDGIKYFSINVDYENPANENRFNNYVFPVQNVSTEGYCPILRSMFQITQPTDLNTLLKKKEIETFKASGSTFKSIEDLLQTMTPERLDFKV